MLPPSVVGSLELASRSMVVVLAVEGVERTLFVGRRSVCHACLSVVTVLVFQELCSFAGLVFFLCKGTANGYWQVPRCYCRKKIPTRFPTFS